MITKMEIKKIIHEANMNYRPRKPSVLERVEVYFRPVNHPKIMKFKRALVGLFKQDKGV